MKYSYGNVKKIKAAFKAVKEKDLNYKTKVGTTLVVGALGGTVMAVPAAFSPVMQCLRPSAERLPSLRTDALRLPKRFDKEPQRCGLSKI